MWRDEVTFTVRLVTKSAACASLPHRSTCAKALEDHSINFYCPHGHDQHFIGKTEAELLTDKLAVARRRAEMAEAAARLNRERANAAERSRAAYKGVATRQRNRIARGVCPCCNRYFEPMARHMAEKHPDYAGAPVVPAE